MKNKTMMGLVAVGVSILFCLGTAGCGDTDAEGVRGEVVTEKQWNAALECFEKDDAVYTIEYDYLYEEEVECVYVDEKLSGTLTDREHFQARKNAEREYLKKTEKSEFKGDSKKILKALNVEREEVDETEEVYAELIGKVYTFYRQNDDDKWVKETQDSSLIGMAIAVKMQNIPLTYSSYEYSSEMKGYILKDALEKSALGGDIYILKFNDDGQLSAMYFESETVSKTSGWSRKLNLELNIVIEYEADDIEMPQVD